MVVVISFFSWKCIFSALPSRDVDMMVGLLLTPADLSCSYKIMCYIKVM